MQEFLKFNASADDGEIRSFAKSLGLVTKALSEAGKAARSQAKDAERLESAQKSALNSLEAVNKQLQYLPEGSKAYNQLAKEATNAAKAVATLRTSQTNPKDLKKEFTNINKVIRARRGQVKTFKMLIQNQKVLAREMNAVGVAGRASEASIKALGTGAVAAFQRGMTASEKFRVRARILARDLDSVGLAIRKMGKEMQWLGRQITLSIATPALFFGQRLISEFKSVEDETIRLAKVMNKDLAESFDLEGEVSVKKVGEAAREVIDGISESLGVNRQMVTAVAADYAALGGKFASSKESLKEFTQLTFELERVGSMDTSSATGLIESLANTMNLQSSGQVKEILDWLNRVENVSSLSLEEMADVMPEILGISEALNLSYKEGSVLLSSMKTLGFDPNESANAIKRTMARLTSGDNVVKEAFASLGVDAFDSLTDEARPFVDILRDLSKELVATGGTLDSIQSAALSDLFGSYQIGRMTGALKSLSETGGNVFDNIMKEASESSITFDSELERIKDSASFRIDQMKAKFKNLMEDFGAQIIEPALKIGQVLLSFLEKLNNLPTPIKNATLAFVGLIGVAGAAMIPISAFMQVTSLGLTGLGKLLPKSKAIMESMLSGLDLSKTRVMQVGGSFEVVGNVIEKNYVAPIVAANVELAKTQALLTSMGAAGSPFDIGDIPEVDKVGPSERVRGGDIDMGTPVVVGPGGGGRFKAWREKRKERVKPGRFDATKRLAGRAKGGAGKAAGNIGLNAALAVGMMKNTFKEAGGGAKGFFALLKNGFMSVIKGAGKLLSVFKHFRQVFKFGMITTVVMALVVMIKWAVGAIRKHWATIQAFIEPSLNKLKASFGKLKEAIEPFITKIKNVFSILGGSEGGEAQQSFAAGFANALDIGIKALTGIVDMATWVIERLSPIFQAVVDIIVGAVNIVKGVVTQDWKQAFQGLVYAALGLLKPVAGAFEWIFDKILGALKTVVGAVGKLISLIPGVEDPLGGVKKSIQDLRDIDAVGYIEDLQNSLRGIERGGKGGPFDVGIGSLIRKSSKKIGELVKKAVKKARPKIEDAGRDIGDSLSEGIDDSNFKDFVSKVFSGINDQLSDLKEKALEAFKKQTEEELAIYDEKIKAIEDLEKREEEYYRLQEYLQNRREMLLKRETDSRNYQAARALAVYEGRIDDARMLDLEERKAISEHTKDLEKLDKDRSRDLLREQRELEKDKIKLAKDAASEQFKIQEDSLKKQLDLITKYAPKTVGQYNKMLADITDLLGGYSVDIWPGQFTNGFELFGEAIKDANAGMWEDIKTSAEWAGNAWLRAFMDPNIPMPDTGAVGGGLSGGSDITDEMRRAQAEAEAIRDLTFHSGGIVPGNRASDVPATLQQGEYVIKRSVVNKIGKANLDSINSGADGLGERFANSGAIGQLGKFARAAGLSFLQGGSNIAGSSIKQVYDAFRSGAINVGGKNVADVMAGGAIERFTNMLLKQFPGAFMMSMHRPGAITAKTGNVSLHGLGRAVDIGGSHNVMQSIFDWALSQAGPLNLQELIYRDKIWSARNGIKTWPYNDHYDHVHLGFKEAFSGLIPMMRGGIVPFDEYPALLHKNEMVLPKPISEKVQKDLAGGGDTYIMVDTFIGEEKWFKEMMHKYDIKVGKPYKRARGDARTRVVSRYNG